MMLILIILAFQVTAIETSTPSFNAWVSGEGERATYVEVPLGPKLKCVKLLFPLTFTGVSTLLTILTMKRIMPFYFCFFSV